MGNKLSSITFFNLLVLDAPLFLITKDLIFLRVTSIKKMNC